MAMGAAGADGCPEVLAAALVGDAVTVTVTRGAAEPLWVVHAQVSRPMAARATMAAVR